MTNSPEQKLIEAKYFGAIGVAPYRGMSVGQRVKFPAWVASRKLHTEPLRAWVMRHAPTLLATQLMLLGCETQAPI